jgi:hypothetical protein
MSAPTMEVPQWTCQSLSGEQSHGGGYLVTRPVCRRS